MSAGPGMLAALVGLVTLAAPPASGQGQPPAPPATFEECEARVKADPSDFRCFGMIAFRTKQWDEAVRRLEAILAADPSLHRARWALAYIESAFGRERALDLYAEAASGLEKDGALAEAALALTQLYDALQKRGRLDEGDPVLARAAELAAKAGHAQVLAKVRTDQGWRAYKKMEYDEAESILREVEASVFASSSPEVQIRWLSAMGAVAWATGRPAEAVRHYRREAALLEKSGNRWELAGVLYNIALALGIQGLEEETRRQLSLALDAAQASGNKGVEADVLLSTAELTSDVLEYRRLCRLALELSRESGRWDTMLLAMRTLGDSLMTTAPRSPGEGAALLEEALAIARRSGDLYHIARSLTLKAQESWIMAYRHPEDPDLKRKAIADSSAAMDAVEKIRDRQEDGLVRARSFTQWMTSYHGLICNLLWKTPTVEIGRADADLAVRTIERMRGRILLDEMDAARASSRLAGDNGDARGRKQVLAEIAAAQRELLDPSLGAERRQAVLSHLDLLDAREVSLRTATMHDDPRLAFVRQPSIPSLDAIESSVMEDEALLSFFVGSESLIGRRAVRSGDFLRAARLLVHTRSGTRIYALPDSDKLDAAVRLFDGLIERHDASEKPSASLLYQQLLEPALRDLPPGVTKLVIVPDGILHRLSFAALRKADGAVPLGAECELSVVPSIASWLRWRGAAPGVAPVPALALADPAAVGVEPSSSPTEAPEVAQRSLAAGMDEKLGRLPYSQQEARAVIRHLGGGSRLLVGADASERSIKTARLNRYGVLHLAAHGLVDDERPERSGVLLAPGSDDEDGLLQVREIVGLDLAGRVVVLSACRSASGTILRGEGVMGLARAFFVAGAHTVIGSLWPLKDDEAARLFERFYGHLAEGRSVAAAMSAAQSDIAASGAPAAAWAGVVVLGDGNVIPLPGGRSRFATVWSAAVAVALIAAVLTLIGLYLYRRSRARSAEHS